MKKKEVPVLLIACMLLILLLTSSCTKTVEKVFTARSECAVLEFLSDPENPRDEYDNCLLFTEEDLRDSDECRKKCTHYCTKSEMEYSSMYTDFSGCHCYCSLKITLTGNVVSLFC